MPDRQQAMSALGRGLASEERWQDLVSWDNVEEIYDPLFQGGTSTITSAVDPGYTPRYQSGGFDRAYPSAPASVVDEPVGFDFTISGPPSLVDAPSSQDQTFSWLSTSPSFSTTATSPLAGRNDRSHGSINPFDDRSYSHQMAGDSPSPMLEAGEQLLTHSFDSSSSLNVLNPFLHGTSHTFNSLDVSASRAFSNVVSNVGGWADQSQTIDTIPELDHVGAIPIPQQPWSNVQNFAPGSSDLEDFTVRDSTRAINIPYPHRRMSPVTLAEASPWRAHVPPMLSVSPEAKRRPRSSTMSRSGSRTEPRRQRNSLMTPSPTSNTFGWVSYQPNQLTNRLVASATEGSGGRRQRGRTKALTNEQRHNAALMRKIGACANCQKRKEKCDRGTPCRSCLDHYKGDLIHAPCRGRLLSNLSKAFLSGRGWHPTARALESFVAPRDLNILLGITYNIPVIFGFGPALYVQVHPLQVAEPLYHEHVIYSWPPTELRGDTHTNVSLPAVLTSGCLSSIADTLDTHLTHLVESHFRSFPLFCSPLRILRDVYVLYLSLSSNEVHSHLLRQALKLLVLVHICGDVTVPAPSSDPILAQLTRTAIPEDITLDVSLPTPCMIRSQLGSVMPRLALTLMNEVLSSLEQLLLTRDCNDWPVALAVLVVTLMTVESIQYHDAKLPYHHKCDPKPIPDQAAKDEARNIDNQNVEYLLEYYSACFSGCHARLRLDWEGELNSDTFVDGVRGAIQNTGNYLEQKATDQMPGDDMGFFFDRLVAKLLTLKL